MAKPIRYRIEHDSHYHYKLPTSGSVMALCLQPRQNEQQRVCAFNIELTPSVPLSVEQDCFGNHHHYFSMHRQHTELRINVQIEVEVQPPPPLPATIAANAWTELRGWQSSFDLWDFTQASVLTKPSAALDKFIDATGIVADTDPLSSLHTLNNKLYECFQYLPGSTSVESSIEQILTTRQGVCQDYAHVMLAIARQWGIPARYVSGYLAVTGQRHEQASSQATHAWVECLLPQLGWVGFDPTNCSQSDARHVRIAIGRDYRDVPPTRGTRQGSGGTHLDVNVKVQRL